MRAVEIWGRFLETLNTAGGHIVMLFVLMIMGVVAYRNGFPKGEDVIVGAFAALLAGLRPGQQPPKPPEPPKP